MESPAEGPWAAAPVPAGTPDWSRAVHRLAGRDPTLGALIRRVGPCTLAARSNSFATLAGAIVAQQISAAAARTVHRRLWALAAGEAPTAEEVLELPDRALRGAGLSRQKVAYLRDLASRIVDGRLDLAALASLDDDQVRASLTSVKGIGAWTADMHLIFTLHRPDVFAGGDAAVLAAMRDLYEIPPGAPAADYARISDRWRPFRSVGVWYMYEHIRALRRTTRSARRSGRRVRRPPGGRRGLR